MQTSRALQGLWGMQCSPYARHTLAGAALTRHTTTKLRMLQTRSRTHPPVSQSAAAGTAAALQPAQLTALTWIVLSKRPSYSALAPLNESAAHHHALAATIQRADADIISIQESVQPCTDVICDVLQTTHALVGATKQYKSFVLLLVRRTLLDGLQLLLPTAKHGVVVAPAVIATIKFNNRHIAVASCHLAPFNQNAALRAQQVKDIMTLIKGHAIQDVILLGDMNMRERETRALCTPHQLEDVWSKHLVRPKHCQYTWDSYVNKYHSDGSALRRRFDRCMVRSSHIRAKQMVLVGDQPASCNPGHYLSDHFGVLVTFEVC